MKNFRNAVVLVFFLALFANAQEAPSPLPGDSTSVSTPEPAPMPAPVPAPMPVQIIPLPMAAPPAPCLPSATRDYQNNLRVVVYLHPLSLFYGAAANMFMFNSTIEVPLSLENSIVIQPAVWLGSSDGYISNAIFDDSIEYEKLKRVGSGIGMRHYVLDRGTGFYLQAIASAYYISAESISRKEDETDDDYFYKQRITTWIKVKGLVGELMFYAGAAHKWQNVSFFYEGGFGFGYDGTKTQQFGYINRLVTSFNLGIGIPF